MAKVTETKEVKSTVTFDIQEFEFEKASNSVSFYRLNDIIIIHDKNNNVTFNLEDICSKLDDMYCSSDYDKVENSVLAVMFSLMTQLKDELE